MTPALALASETWPATIEVKGEPWHLSLNLPDFATLGDEGEDGRRRIYTFLDRGREMILSVMIEKVPGMATMDGCREINARRAAGGGTFHPIDVQTGSRGEAAVVELSIPLSADGKVVQRHIFACRTRGNRYIDTHVSKVRYAPSDRDIMLGVLDAIAIIDPAAP